MMSIEKLHEYAALTSLNAAELDVLSFADTVAMIAHLQYVRSLCNDKAQAMVLAGALGLLVHHRDTITNRLFTALSI